MTSSTPTLHDTPTPTRPRDAAPTPLAAIPPLGQFFDPRHNAQTVRPAQVAPTPPAQFAQPMPQGSPQHYPPTPQPSRYAFAPAAPAYAGAVVAAQRPWTAPSLTSRVTRTRLLAAPILLALGLIALLVIRNLGWGTTPTVPPSSHQTAGPGVGAPALNSKNANKLPSIADVACRLQHKCDDLTWKQGNVQLQPTSYVIFWGDGWKASGNSLSSTGNIALSYFQDVGGSAFANILTQYSDAHGHITKNLALGGAWTDTATPQTTEACNAQPTIEESALLAEIRSVINGQHLPLNSTDATFYLFTPQGYAVHTAALGCSNTNFCAFHGWSGSFEYAVLPYLDTKACGVSQSPNHDPEADALVNQASLMQFDAISDPFVGTGWVDAHGYEIAARCAWKFPSGTTHLRNGGVFFVQTEYSNASHSCVTSR